MPMISDVVALPIYDRFFVLTNTFYFMGVHQVNVRAYYKRLSDAGISETPNRYLFYCGICSCISLPMIGVFDCVKFQPIHYLFASLFFLSAGVYTFILAKLMHDNKDRFPIKDEFSIDTNFKFSYFMVAIITLMILSLKIFGDKYWLTPALEWLTVLCHMNYFSIINFTNPFYDSIHPYGDKTMKNSS